jgi:hypothetical protein
VGWQLPGGILERPIQGNRLSPSLKSGTSAARHGSENMEAESAGSADLIVRSYPNPVEGKQLTISIENTSEENPLQQIEIRQLTGVTVYSQRILCHGGCSTEVNTNDLPPGLYILHVKMQGRTFTERLVIP